MARVHIICLTGVVGLVASGCVRDPDKGEIQTIREYLPEIELSTDSIEFGTIEFADAVTRTFTITNSGELPMGLASVSVNDDEGYGQNWRLSYSADTLTCPEGVEIDPVEDEEDTTAKSAVVDSGSSGGEDSGGATGGSTGSGGDDTGDEEPVDTGGLLIMNGGCSLVVTVDFDPVDVGQIFGSITVVTESQTVEEDSNDDPEYWRDPDEFVKKILLAGKSERGSGNIVVTPLTVDMGHYWPGETSSRYVYVYNVGDGDLTVQEPTFAADCDPGFSIDLSRYDEDGILPGGTSTLFEVLFTPEETDTAKCELTLLSSDGDSPEIEIKLQGNAGEDPENVAPQVVLYEPEVGYVHTSGDPVVFKMRVTDKNQPATSLGCKIRSATILQASLVSCVPSDESGYVEVEIPVDLLEEGVDTMEVRVTDDSERRAYASTTVLWKVGYPESDDDGDGYGNDPDLEHIDCDDSDPTVYPNAAEIFDGKDNDCDGGIDEGTLGFDDDGDSVTEADGDCDDLDSSTYPGAYEEADQKDNDCDGIVDEGTALYDDDGDGFAEVDLDCNDNDYDINPAAIEYCDGIDNNCNGLRDQQEVDGCISFDSSPIIFGGVRMAETAIGAGESTTMSIFVWDEDGQDITCSWQEDADLTAIGHVAIDNPTATSITWEAPPELDEDSPGEVYAVYVVCQDEDQNQVWTFDEILVYPEPVAAYTEKVINPAEAGCGGVSSGYAGARGTPALESLLILPGLGIFAAARRLRRRREED